MSRWKGIVGQGMTAEEFQSHVDSLVLDDWSPEFVVLHNTQIPRFTEWHKGADGIRNIRGLEGYYRDEQKWSGGPHLFVADLIWLFTPLTVPGVHAPSWNNVAWGVEMVGDYDHEPLSQEVLDNTIAALATLHAAIRASADSLRFHKEDPLTTHRSCPGVNVVKSEIVAALELALQQ